MRSLRLLLVVFVVLQILTNGKAVAAVAATYNAISPSVVGIWQEQTLIDRQDVGRFIQETKSKMIAAVLPRIKENINISKAVEDINRLKMKVRSKI